MATASHVPLLLRIPEVQARLAVGRSTVYELISSGELEVIYIGRSVRVTASSVVKWVEKETAKRRVESNYG